MLTLQLKRTTTADNPPATLAEGELAIGLADTPPSLYVGNGTAVLPINPSGTPDSSVTFADLAAATGDITFTITYP
jgi:hypothetical protein